MTQKTGFSISRKSFLRPRLSLLVLTLVTIILLLPVANAHQSPRTSHEPQLNSTLINHTQAPEMTSLAQPSQAHNPPIAQAAISSAKASLANAGDDDPAGLNWRKPFPAERYHHAMAYDSARGVTVLFGGYGSNVNNETWEWDGNDWHQRTPTTSPSARHEHAMVYDSARGVTVLFGGLNGGRLNDTWEWDGNEWVERTPTTSPSARYDHTMVYDSARQVTVLFGGLSSGYLNETWEWDGNDWLQRTPTTSPSARHDHAMVYHSARGVTVLFGGWSSGPLNDTWEWDGNDWLQRTPSTSPPIDIGHAMGYDSVREVTVLFGGGSSGPLNDTWEWDGNDWLQRTPSTSPPARFYHAMAYDSARQVTVLFGGGFLPLNDIWEWDGSEWVEPSPTTSPLGRPLHAMAYDSARGVTLLFGGDTVPLNDSWEWDGNQWLERTPTTSPAARHYHAMAYDSARGVTVLFGGDDLSSSLNDTWEWDGNQWVERNPTMSPPARYYHAMAYDSARGVTVLFGGYNNEGSLNDIWEWDGNDWVERTPSTSPSARYDHAMAYDSAHGVTVLFGGDDLSSSLNDTWEWDGKQWIEQSPITSPLARSSHAMVYDSARDVTLLFGGHNLSPSYNDTWEWDGNDWVEATPPMSPSARWAHAMAYDGLRGMVVLFGGTNGHDETWEYGPPLLRPNLSPIVNSDGDGDYLVAWDSVTNAITYTLEEDDEASFTSPVVRYEGSEIEVEVTGKPAGSTWYYRVRAANEEGESVWSEVESVSVALSATPTPTPSATPNPIASFPFADGFESGWLGDGWSVSTSSQGAVRVDEYAPFAGRYAVLLEDTEPDENSSVAALILTIDLAAQSQVELNFWLRDLNDENHDADGLFISDDQGGTWHPVLSFNNGPVTYEQELIDLDAEASANGLTLTSDFQIKFQFYDNGSAPNDGYAIDEVQVRIPGPPPTPTPIPPDEYEVDNTCGQANALATDGIPQEHTFHEEADQDWLTFSANSGTTYLIGARVPAGSEADVTLDLYESCNEFTPAQQQDYTFSTDVRMSFTPPADGTYYLRLLNNDPNIYGSNVAYNLSIRDPSQTKSGGALIVVAGKYRDEDELQNNINHVTNAVYNFALEEGCQPDEVYYLAPDMSLDGNGDGVPDVNALASTTNLQHAITDWAVSRVGPERPLTLYLMDHGSQDELYLDGADSPLTSTQLDGWLDELESAVPGLESNIIVEACYSGSFISNPASISQQNRSIMTSAADFSLAYASQEGAIFSDIFLDALRQGYSLEAAFDEGANAARLVHPDQIAWMDDNGDGIYNLGDGQIAAQQSFACAAPVEELWPPYIFEGTVQANGEISAEVRDDQAVEAVWAIVYAPEYESPDSSTEMIPDPQAIALEAQGDDHYSITLPDLDQSTNGTYRIMLYASDGDGLTSRPLEVSLDAQEIQTIYDLYLPTIIR